MALVLHQMLKVALGLLAAGLLITLVGSNTDYWFVGSGVHYGLWNICSALTCVDLASVVSPVPVDCVEKRGLSWDRMASITTHGAKSFTGKNIGMVKLLKDKLTTENPGSDILSFHCSLHQESLCKSALDIKHVIEPVISVVNIIKSKALNHRQFKSLLEDLEAEYEDVLYHNNVGWLSLAKVLKRVWALREEIIVFLDMKEISCEFKTKMGCEEWRFDFMFAVDMFEKLNDLSVKFQGKGLFAHEMWTHVKAFKLKLRLFAQQAGEGKFCQFPLLGKQKVPGNIATKVKSYLKSLEEEMERRFQDFSNRARVIHC